MRAAELTEPLVGLSTPDFYGSYLDQAIEAALAKVRSGSSKQGRFRSAGCAIIPTFVVFDHCILAALSGNFSVTPFSNTAQRHAVHPHCFPVLPFKAHYVILRHQQLR